MSEGSSRLLPASAKRKKLEKRHRKVMMNRKIKSESEIVQGALKALVEHKKIVHTLKLHMKDMENQMVVEGNSILLEQITRALRRDMKVLKNLRKMKKMKKKMTDLTVGEDKENESAEGGVKHEEEGESDDHASRDCTDLKEEDEGVAKGVDGGDDEHAYSKDIEDLALRLREHIKEDDYTYLPAGEDKVNYRKWASYYKQIRESKGFDIDDFPGVCSHTQIVPVRDLETYPEHHLLIVELTTDALNGFNSETGRNYKFLKLVKANAQVVAGVMYFITFEAMDPEAANASETFQTKIWYRGIEGAEVKFCIPKNPSHGVIV